MKITTIAKTLLLSAGLLTVTTACNSLDTEGKQKITYTFAFETGGDDNYNQQGIWNSAYDPQTNVVVLSSPYGVNLILSHSATAATATEPATWTGFAPTRSKNVTDYSAEGWNNDNSWGAIPGSGVAGSMEYLMAKWDPAESVYAIPAVPSLGMRFGVAKPISICITNATYTFWELKNYTKGEAADGDDYYYNVVFNGVRNGILTGKVEAQLLHNGALADAWNAVDLRPLDEVDMIYVQIDTNITDASGRIAVPTLFALDNLTVFYDGL